jgi:hypothetical protein
MMMSQPEPQLDRYDQLDDVLGTTAASFLGLTLRCARCHDHKFEPLKQSEYYRMLAVFEPLKRPQKTKPKPIGWWERKRNSPPIAKRWHRLTQPSHLYGRSLTNRRRHFGIVCSRRRMRRFPAFRFLSMPRSFWRFRRSRQSVLKNRKSW